MDECITQSTPANIFSISTQNGYYCSENFYYTIVNTVTTTAPSTEPTIEPTPPTNATLPTISALVNTTATIVTTAATVVRRKQIPCNYVIDTTRDAFPFYVTYPIDECYVTPKYGNPVSQMYECNNIDSQSVIIYESEFNNNCDMLQQFTQQTLQYGVDNIIPVCNIDNGMNTDICTFKLIKQYVKSSNECIKQYDENLLDKSVPWILNYCIWVQSQTNVQTTTTTETFIYNYYNELQNIITQTGYSNMEDCLNNANGQVVFEINSYACGRYGYYYEIQKDIISSTTTTTKLPTGEPTIEPTLAPVKKSINVSVTATDNPTSEPTMEPTLAPVKISGNITVTTSGPTMEPTLSPVNVGGRNITSNPTNEPTIEPTIKPTVRQINPLNCDYGIRMEPQKYYETLVVNKCYNDDRYINDNNYKSIDRICVNDSLMNRYYTDESCIGSMTQESTPGNVKAYCNNNGNIVTNECDYVLLKEYNTCKFLDIFHTISFIVNECILFQDGIYIKNIYSDNILYQYSYPTLDNCDTNINGNIQIRVVDGECQRNNTFKIIVPGVTTTTTTTTPAPVLYINTTVLTTKQPTKPPKGVLECNYGTMPPIGKSDVYFETFITNKCYSTYDELYSRKYECYNGKMYLFDYYGDTCDSIPVRNMTVDYGYSGHVEEHCNYNENNTQSNACDYIWLKQFNEQLDECAPNDLHKTMAFIIGKCIAFVNGKYTIRNDINRDQNSDYIYSITQYSYDSISECEQDVFGQYSSMHWEIINKDCPQNFAYWQEIIEPKTITFEPTPQPIQPTITFEPTLQPIQPTIQITPQPTQSTIVTDMPTQAPNIYGLDCNYGVNYSLEDDFYGTFILNTCYNLNVKANDIDTSLEYECDFNTNKVNENVYLNQQCSDNINHTNIMNLQTNQCDINKINGNDQCEFLWLNAFRQHSGECTPHIHTIIKFGMIINKCILYNDGTAFKNIYTQTEDNKRQIIQFQYLNINDCIYDNYITDSTNIDVTQSIADDIYYFIHEDCTDGRYYTVQPVHQTVNISTTNINIITTAQTSTESSTEYMSTIETGLPTNICNYMIREDSYMDFYSTILENKCYSHETGSKKYECKNNKFMVTEWLNDRMCDGPYSKPKMAQGKSYCVDNNNKLCNNIISILQYYSNQNCTKEEFVEEYTFITNICLQYIGHKNDKNETIYIYNQYDSHNPTQMIQLHFNSEELCMNMESGQGIEEDLIQINNEQCTNEFYYEIIILSQPTISPTININNDSHISEMDEPYYKKIYKSIFGPEGPTSIEFDILIMIIIVIFSCLCCGILCWCGWLKGCTDMCWNVLCCGKYSQLSDTPLNNEDDTGDESVEMGAVAHVLVPDDNMELAALSEHRDDDDYNNNRNRNQRRRNKKPKKPGKRNRL